MTLPASALRPFRWLRRSALLAESQAVGASITLAAECPAHPAYVEIRLTGPDLTGTVTVNGKLDGAVVTETLTFTGPVANDRAKDKTCKLMDCSTSITTTGLAGEATTPQLQARWVGSGNEAVHANAELEDCVLGYLEISRGTWPAARIGTEVERGFLALDDHYDNTPRRGDLFVETLEDGSDGATWEVVGVPGHLGSLRPHHFELTVRLRNDADQTERSP